MAYLIYTAANIAFSKKKKNYLLIILLNVNLFVNYLLFVYVNYIFHDA